MKRKIVEPVQYESMVPKLAEELIKGDKTVKELDFKNMVKLSKHAAGKEDLVKSIQEIFPDIELAISLVTSLVVSPNDMGNGGLNYKINNFSLPTEVNSMVNGIIGTYVDNTYNISDNIGTIIEESLFTKGSYVELNIPPSNIQDLLLAVKNNSSVAVESILATHGDYVSSIKSDDTGVFNFTSNPSMLLSETFKEARLDLDLETTINGGISAGVESLIMSDSGYGIMNADNISNDKPIIKKMASHNVIPVADSENPSKHYGYFIILKDTKVAKGDGPKSNTGAGLIDKVNKSLGSMTDKAPTLGDITELKDNLIKTQLQKYLDKSKYGELANIDFDISDDLVLDIADSIISKSPVNVLFVPSNLVSYYAINFRDNGMGESLLERLTVLMSMRAILMFTKMLSYIKSSVTTTDVKVDLDPDDPEYKKSMEAIMAEVIKNRQISMPIGILNTDDLVDWSHKLGFSFNFKHPGLPDVNIDIEETANEINPIDDSLKEDIDKLIITSLYLTPEMIDNGYSPDFATTIVANNLLLKKRIVKLQNSYNVLITKDVVKKLKIDGRVRTTLKTYLEPMIKKVKSHLIKNDTGGNKELIKKAKDEDLIEYVINKVIDNIKVALPTPETTEDTNTSDLMDNYTDLLDNVIDKLFSSDLIPSDYIGTMGDNLDDMKNLIKHTLLRRYIDDNNILPDFTKMFVLDEDGKPLFNLLDDFNVFGESLSALIVPFLKDNKKMVAKLDKKQDKLDNAGGDEETSDDGHGEEEEPTDDSGDVNADDGATDDEVVDENNDDEPVEEDPEEEPTDGGDEPVEEAPEEETPDDEVKE